MKRLNFGCGKDVKAGYVNADIAKLSGVDVHFDFEQFPYPFKNNEFGEIFCRHVLEQLLLRQLAVFRVNDADSPIFQLLDIFPDKHIGEHFIIHRGGDNHRPGMGDKQGGQGVVRQAIGHFGDGVGSRRSDNQQIGIFRRPDMLHGSGSFGIEDIIIYRASRESLESQRRHKTSGIGAHHHLNDSALAHQQTQQLNRLVRGDTATDAQHDVLML